MVETPTPEQGCDSPSGRGHARSEARKIFEQLFSLSKTASVYSKEFYVGIPWSLSLSERSKDSYLRAVCEHGRPIPRISFKLAPFQQEKTNGKQIEA